MHRHNTRIGYSQSAPIVANTYIPGDAWFTCDRCSQRWRRSRMIVEWTNLRVCPKCLDPRPPQMMPPNVYPEGIPFPDARPPQDNPDDMGDDTSLYSVTGGQAATIGQYDANTSVGSLSPQPVLQTPVPQGPNVLTDDVAIRTGPISAPQVPYPPLTNE